MQYNLFNNKNESYYDFIEMINNINNYNKDEVVNALFKQLRDEGFPHYTITPKEKVNHFNKLKNYNHMLLLKDNIITQSMHCLRLCWSYFPHFWSVRCGQSRYTAMDVFNDDTLLKKTLSKTYDYCIKYENNKITYNRIRQSLKVYNGVQCVSNFRPTASKIIYELFGGDGVLWDMSSGWGGRLIGALSSDKIKVYIGTEPSSKTYKGLLDIKNDFNYLDKKVIINKIGSEDFLPDKNSLDLCFTSPPYFDTEKYSNEKTQSYIKYNNINSWVDGFLYKTIENCNYGLKNNGYLVLNIANTKSAYNIEDGLFKIAKNLNLKYINSMSLYLSSISGKGAKYEPVYIFKKEIK